MTARYTRLGRVGAVATIALALGACSSPEFEKQRIKLGGWTQERMLADGWMKAPPQKTEPVYCYRTLAGPDCHVKPVPGQSLRLTVPVPPPAPAKDE